MKSLQLIPYSGVKSLKLFLFLCYQEMAKRPIPATPINTLLEVPARGTRQEKRKRGRYQMNKKEIRSSLGRDWLMHVGTAGAGVCYIPRHAASSYISVSDFDFQIHPDFSFLQLFSLGGSGDGSRRWVTATLVGDLGCNLAQL